jgi:hypothetical protein
MDVKVKLAREMLEKDGHTVRRIVLGDDPRYLVDEEFPLSVKEMHELAEGVYSFAELKDDLLVRRGKEESHT